MASIGSFSGTSFLAVHLLSLYIDSANQNKGFSFVTQELKLLWGMLTVGLSRWLER